jgi:hypothetical protein
MPRPRPYINRMIQELSLLHSVVPRPPGLKLAWSEVREEVFEAAKAQLDRSGHKEGLVNRLPFELAFFFGESHAEFERVFGEVEGVLKAALDRRRTEGTDSFDLTKTHFR